MRYVPSLLFEIDICLDMFASCQGCDQPFENPSFFQRDGMPFCERCFSIMIKNEM